MSAAFFKMSRSIRSRSFSRRSRAFSATRSDGDGAAACVLGRLGVPVACTPNCIIHRRSTVSCRPSSAATSPADSPLRGHPINRLPLERLRKYPALTTLHPTLLSSSEKLAWVSTETGEDHLEREADAHSDGIDHTIQCTICTPPVRAAG